MNAHKALIKTLKGDQKDDTTKEASIEGQITAIGNINKNHDKELTTLTQDNFDRINAISKLKKDDGDTQVAIEKKAAAHELEIQKLETEHTKTDVSIKALDKDEGKTTNTIAQQKAKA